MSGAPELVDWALAERVARRVAARGVPQVDPRSRQRLIDDFAELTPIAEELVEASTGLRSIAGPARAEVTDRGGWAKANIGSFRRLLRPILQRAASEGGIGRNLPAPMASAARLAAGTELGAVLGWMSTRVLGQYDLFRAEEGEAPSDAVYYVGPNVIALERRHGFPPREFRLWIAVHELTHRAQFTGVPWMRHYFLGLVDEGVTLAAPDSKQVLAAITRMAGDVRARRNPLGDAGLLGALAPPEQLATIRRIQALMSLLEGHGDITMNRAAAERIPGAQRFARTLQTRRESAGGLTRLMQQLLGIDAKMKQYKEGEEFVEAVERAGGPELFARVWEGPDSLPSLEEVRDPARWVSRLGGRRLELA
ncbi:MAG: zinc-dependent metalloprotease [Acidimicrobiales bacterium]